MKKKKSALILALIFLALANYQLAKLGQRVTLELFPAASYPWSITSWWLLVCGIPALLTWRDSGFRFDLTQWQKNWKDLLLLELIILAGMVLFVAAGVTKYFHDVKYPMIFFIVTPVVEELLFRGWIYGQLQRLNWYPVLISAALFGLHHLQYFGYHPTAFALFQLTYTFGLGILFGLMRKKSSSIYPSLLAHIAINWISVYF